MTHTRPVRRLLATVAVVATIPLAAACGSSTQPPASGGGSAAASASSAPSATTSAQGDAAYCAALESGQKELESMSSKLSDTAALAQGKAVLEKIEAAAPQRSSRSGVTSSPSSSRGVRRQERPHGRDGEDGRLEHDHREARQDDVQPRHLLPAPTGALRDSRRRPPHGIRCGCEDRHAQGASVALVLLLLGDSLGGLLGGVRPAPTATP